MYNNNSAEMYGFCSEDKIKIVHLQYCKRFKKCTQNDFVYGELGRTCIQNSRYYMIIKYWLKIIFYNDNKFIKHIYNMM